MCENCKPNSPCNRHAGRNAREINNWLDDLVAKYFTKPKQRNPYYSKDDWEMVRGVPGGMIREN